MPTITYREENQDEIVLQQEKEGTILEAALQNDHDHYHVCGGKARCTTCRVYVLNGKENLAPRTEAELKMARAKNWSNNIRLACQTKILGDVTLKRLVVDEIDVDLVRSEGNITKPPTERSLAIMFCDVENFTGFAATHLHNPYDIIHLLNRYYKEIGEPIFSNRGYIDKYMGDGFLALFGCDETNPAENCLNAVRASLRMLARVKALNKYTYRQFSHQFRIRIGLHYGSVIVGEVGYRANKQLTIIGNAVNVASRIENANKEFGTQILASQEMIDQIRHTVQTSQVFTTQLRGQNRSHILYEIIGFQEPDTIFLIQSTFEKIAPYLDEFTKMFFEQLFELDCSTKPMFDYTDIKNQKQMVINMIGILAQGINRSDIIMSSIQEMNERHIGRDVQPEQYRIAGKALVQVLEKYLGKDFTPEVKKVWTDFYEQIIRFVK